MNAGCMGVQPSKPSQGLSPTTLLHIATSILPNGETQSVYQASLVASGRNTAIHLEDSVRTNPSKVVSFNSRTGTISGTPVRSGQSAVVFAVSDHSQPASETATASLTFEITAIAGRSLTITGLALPNGQVSQMYDTSVTASGGTAPYTWSISSGSLPSGLDLASASGEINGTPNANGEYQFTLKVIDSSVTQQSATQSNAIIVSNNQFDQYGGSLNRPSRIHRRAYSAPRSSAISGCWYIPTTTVSS